MKFQEALEKIAADFTRFWNVWDIERLCCMMSENAILESPMIKKVYPEHTSLQIKGREEIRRYWIHLRNITGGFEVNQISVHKRIKKLL
ncbi:MAG: nuclear transport factor 2 family protein [Bacteroidota bacterium]|nr:MAG: nuclear transport factor 2 family protein [Bacteroidota bacterium]